MTKLYENGREQVHITIATDSNANDVRHIQLEAFGYEKEAALTDSLLHDDSAKPLLSLLAHDKGKAVGHILFTRARIAGSEDTVSAMLLAPLAVLPHAQGKGVGGALIKAGLEKLSGSGVDLVFVLGHPSYYPRYGFEPAGALGFQAPYPIAEKNADAWMVQELRDGFFKTVRGTVICADALNQPEHWRE
jgi:putative acetyltransferase